jgi:hypothetical protein
MIIPTTSLESSAAASRDLKYRLAALWCIVTVAMLASCGSAEPSGADGETLSSGVNVDTTVKLTQSEVLEIQRTSSEFQVGLLQDGLLTFSEYEEAFLAMVQCVEAAGLTLVERPQLTAEEKYYLLLWYRDRQEMERDQPKADACRAEYFESIDRTWARRDPSAYASMYASALEALKACLSEAGSDLPEKPSLDDLHVLRDAFDPVYFRCLQATQESHRIPGWAP